MSTITVDACAGFAYAAGFRGDALATITAIAGPESGYDKDQLNDNPRTGDLSYGLWQINMIGDLGPARRRTFGITSNDQLFDPLTNAKAAWSVSGGGTNFNPWTTYKKGLHRSYLAAATQAAQSVEARGGASGSSPALEASGNTGVLAGQVLPPGGYLELAVDPPTTFPRIGLNNAGGVANLERIARQGVKGSIQMGVDSITEIQCTYVDELFDLNLGQYFIPHSDARYADQRLTVAANEWGDVDGVPALTVTFRPVGVDGLRSTDPQGPTVTWSDMSPTEVLAERAKFVGMRFYGKDTARRSTISRLGVDDSSRSNAENDWDMGQRLAKEEGFWFFESADAIYFAPPSWLWGKTTAFNARWRAPASERYYEVVATPEARATLNEYPLGLRRLTRVITIKLPRWRGEQVRPGWTCYWRGIPLFDTAIDSNTQVAKYIVTSVSFQFDGGVEPVEVELTEAIDPIPQPSADSDGTDLTGTAQAGAGTPSATGANFPSGSGVSNQGKGTYGYQYDPVGDTPATGPQPGAVVMMNHILAHYPGSKNDGIFNNRPVSGTSSLSVHAEGRAGDSGVPTSSKYGDNIAAFLVGNANLFGIQLVIWNAQLWSARTRKWRAFTAANGKTDDTSLHRNHIHWELCWEAAKYLNEPALTGEIKGGSTSDGRFWQVER